MEHETCCKHLKLLPDHLHSLYLAVRMEMEEQNIPFSLPEGCPQILKALLLVSISLFAFFSRVYLFLFEVIH